MQRAASLLPDSAVVHSNYASVLAASGRYADALAATRRALELESRLCSGARGHGTPGEYGNSMTRRFTGSLRSALPAGASAA